MMRILTSAARLTMAACALALASFSAKSSEIVDIGGDLALIPAPSAMNFSGSLYSGFVDTRPVIFNEYSNHEVPVFSETPLSQFTGLLAARSPADFIGSDFLTLDITSPGTYPPSAETPGRITSRTAASTYIVHYEPSDFVPVGSVSGYVTFGTEIIGLQTHIFSLEYARELLFDRPGISLYGSSGVEDSIGDPSTSDVVTISSDRRRVDFVFNVNGATDDMRIFVEAETVPEPGTTVIFAGLSFGLLLSRRRRLR
jgi:hypothetical protein